MADVVWKLNGTTLADLGITSCVRELSNLTEDTLKFRTKGLDFDEDPLFEYGETVTLTRDGVTVFKGRVTFIPRYASPREEYQDYQVLGPFWYLDNLVYQQLWTIKDADHNDEQVYKSRVILGQNAAGAKVTVGAVINEILSFAIAAGAPISVGTISVGIQAPWDEAVDITCGEAIRRMLRWVPDVVGYFDYTTSNPTFHLKRRSALDTVAFDLADGAPINSLNILRRFDLQVPAVVINYEKESWTDGDDEDVQQEIPEENVETDAYPSGSDGREFGAVVATVELAEGNVGYVSQILRVEEIPSDLTADKAWWKERVPWLNEIADDDLEILSVAREREDGGGTFYENEITEGEIRDWMSANSSEDIFTALMSYKVRDDDNDEVKIEEKIVTVSLTATDALGGFYPRMTSLEEAEPVPENLAETFYESLSGIEYSGELVLLRADCTADAYMGKVLNIDGGRAAWSSMNAIIQKVVSDIDAGVTRVTFGPPGHLSIQDLLEQLRANRGRRTAINYLTRTSGDASKSKPSATLRGGVKGGPTSGGGKLKKVLMKNEDGTKRISLDPDEVVEYKVLTAIRDADDNIVIKPDYVRAHS